MNDSKTLEDQIKYMWNNIKGFHVIHFIYTGYELDLFNTIEKSGKYGLSAKELSVQKTINLYYIEKWCLSGVAWNILIEEANKYKLAPHMEYILNRPGDPRYLLPYVKSCIDHFGPDMKNHSTYYANGKKYTFQDHGIDFSKDIGNITEGLQTLLTHKILPNISSLNDLFSSKCKVLDFGCGTAKLLIKLSDKYPNCDYFGMDIDDSGIKLGRKDILSLNKEKNITLINSNEDTLPENSSIDIVTMVEVLHEIDKNIRQDIIINISKLIKKGGFIVILDETMPEKDQIKEDKYTLSILTQYNEMTWGNEVPTENEQNKLLANAGFKIADRKIIGGLFTLLIAKKL